MKMSDFSFISVMFIVLCLICNLTFKPYVKRKWTLINKARLYVIISHQSVRCVTFWLTKWPITRRFRLKIKLSLVHGRRLWEKIKYDIDNTWTFEIGKDYTVIFWEKYQCINRTETKLAWLPIASVILLMFVQYSFFFHVNCLLVNQKLL